MRALKSLIPEPAKKKIRDLLGVRSHEPFWEPIKFSEDGLQTVHNCDFLNSPRFISAYQAGENTGSWGGWQLRWRAHVVLWAAAHAYALEGDFVECGVNKGGFARMIIEYLCQWDGSRQFFLFDTFEGFSADLLSEQEKQTVAKNYKYEQCLVEVQNTFAAFPFVKIIPGKVPDTLHSIDISRVAFLSIDMNCVAPEIASLRFFWPKLTAGATVLLDDYGFSMHHEQKTAFDQLAKEIGVPILSLPTGQGMLLKPP